VFKTGLFMSVLWAFSAGVTLEKLFHIASVAANEKTRRVACGVDRWTAGFDPSRRVRMDLRAGSCFASKEVGVRDAHDVPRRRLDQTKARPPAGSCGGPSAPNAQRAE